MVLKHRIPTSWTDRGSYPNEGQIFRAVQNGPKNHPASCTMGTEVFLWVKRPERGATTHFLLVPGREWVGGMLPSLLCACIGMSWGDLYFYSYIINVTNPEIYIYIFF